MTRRWTRALLGSLLAVVLAAGGLAVMATAAAAADVAAVILNGGSSAQWLETRALTNTNLNRQYAATLLVQHDPSEPVTAVTVIGATSAVANSGPVPMTVTSVPGTGISVVHVAFDPGSPPGFRCRLFDPPEVTRVTKSITLVVAAGASTAEVTGSVVFEYSDLCLFGITRGVVYDTSQSATTAAPGEAITFGFKARSFGGSNVVEQRWRRLDDGATGGFLRTPGPGSDQPDTITMALPSRGRYVAEVRTDPVTADPQWFKVGAVDVNDAASSLTGDLALTGPTLAGGDVPSVNVGDPVTAAATMADAGGAVQQLEWDADGDGTYERTERTSPTVSDGAVVHADVAGAQLQQAVDTSIPGVVTVRARATDNGALDLADGQTRSVEVSAQLRVNAPPTVADQGVTTAEDTAVTFDLAAADPDAQPAPLSFAVVDPPDHGTVELVDGAAVYIPAADHAGDDSFTWTASDGPSTGAWTTSAPATASITVTPVNDQPVAVSQSVEGDEDGTVPITLVATDVEGDVAYAVVIAPSHGDVDCEGPACTYRPAPDFHGTDTFVFAARDGDGAESRATVAIDVRPVNDAPIASDLAVEAQEDAPQTVLLVASDVDGDDLAYEVVAAPANGTVDCGGSDCTYTSALDFHGTDTFSYAVSDPGGARSEATVTLDVRPVNDAPVAIPQDLATDEDTPVLVTMAGIDVDGDALVAAVSSSAARGTVVDHGDGTATYAPDADWWGTDGFEQTVSDPSGASGSAQVRVTVHAVNDAPLALDVGAATLEDAPVTVSLVASDVDGDELTWEVVEGPSTGRVEGEGPDLTYVPDPDAHGRDSFVVRVTDPSGAHDDAVVTMEVSPVNDAPVAQAGVVTLDEDTEATFVLVATDVDGDTLTFTVDADPEHGTIACDGSSCTYLPDPDRHGGDTVVFTVTDPDGASSTAVVTLVVEPANDAPVATDVAVATLEDLAVPVALLATDVDGDPLTFEVTTDPALGTVSCDGPSCTYTPDADANGTDTFSYVVRDPSGAHGTGLVVVEIAEVNDAPVAPDLTVANEQQKSVTFSLAATDVDGDVLHYTVVTSPTSGTVSCTTEGTCVYAPTAGFAGTDGMTYRADDGSGGTADATVSFVATLPDVVELLVELADTTASYAGGSAPAPLRQQLRNAVDRVVAGRERPACSALSAYETIVGNTSARSFTDAARGELLADSRYIRAVIGC